MSEKCNNMKEINYYRVDTIPYYYIAEIVKTDHPLYGKKVKIDNFRIADTTNKILHLDWREAIKSHVEKINTNKRKEQLFTQGKEGETDD
tara:strand:+ start:512 stop:781 length:270 start_codon:yes stop_codon:yes gene_type:complete